jgi:two-component system, OmpR family, response regulator
VPRGDRPVRTASHPGTVSRRPSAFVEVVSRFGWQPGRMVQRVVARRPNVLVVDDEENISFLVSSALRLAEIDVVTAASGREALTAVSVHRPDAVVLDIQLPDLDGFEVLQRLRADGCTAPVLFLTARHTTADKVRGLTAGGDDYIVKPFALEELVARVQVALRRRGALTTPSRIVVGDLELDDDAHRVWRAGAELRLSATEFKLLRCLMVNSGRVVTRAQILDHVWEYDFDGESAIIESFISNLRKKVDHVEPRLIHTVRGVGYSVREPS